VTFTDPAVAAVGLTENQARTHGIRPLVSTLPLPYVPRGLAARDTRGFLKLVADAATRKIIGAHILAVEAGEMITEPALAIKLGLTLEDLASVFHPGHVRHDWRAWRNGAGQRRARRKSVGDGNRAPSMNPARSFAPDPGLRALTSPVWTTARPKLPGEPSGAGT